MARSNLEHLTSAAERLGPLCRELVFVGGAVTCLLITDEGADPPRPTLDIDAIAGITSYAAYAQLAERLRASGFAEDTREGAPVCRWCQDDIVMDVMPLVDGVFGFSNKWYREAMATATDQILPNGLAIRVITGPCFLATKLEAFASRGRNDIAFSHDLEDIVFVVDGRRHILEEVQNASPDLRVYLKEKVSVLVGSERFIDALAGYLPPDEASQARIGMVLQRLRAIAAG